HRRRERENEPQVPEAGRGLLQDPQRESDGAMNASNRNSQHPQPAGRAKRGTGSSLGSLFKPMLCGVLTGAMIAPTAALAQQKPEKTSKRVEGIAVNPNQVRGDEITP